MSEARPCCIEGWYGKRVPVGHPDFGKLFVCDCPAGQAIRRKRIESALGSSLMPTDQQAMTFDNFYPKQGVKLTWPDPRDKSFEAERIRTRIRSLQATNGGTAGNLRRAKIKSLEFANKPQWFFTLLGESGCGKTHLAAAIANECMAQGRVVVFAVVTDLLDSLRATFDKRSQVSYDERLATYLEADLLILDDIGAEQDTEWAGEKLYQLINYRYNHHLPLVVTTNDIPVHLDSRLHSRLFDTRNRNVELLAGDYRLRRKG